MTHDFEKNLITHEKILIGRGFARIDQKFHRGIDDSIKPIREEVDQIIA